MLVQPPVSLNGFISDSISWLKHKGNRPGTPESRAGVVSAEDVNQELEKLQAQGGGSSPLTVGNIPADQIILAAGVGLALVLVLTGGRGKGRR